MGKLAAWPFIALQERPPDRLPQRTNANSRRPDLASKALDRGKRPATEYKAAMRRLSAEFKKS
jgi:hypothetical protein